MSPSEKQEENNDRVQADQIRLRTPADTDGANLHALVARCKPLDENSTYCNLLQCSHFRHTSAAAEANGGLVGFVSGHRIPERPDTLFVWQVAVDRVARGHGLGRRLITNILSREQNRDIRFVETTITPGNDASFGLFRGLARRLDADIQESVMFDRHTHFNDQHDDEILLRIGAFASPSPEETRQE